MLISLKNMLMEAKREHYAVGAFNIGNKDIFEAIVEAAESLQIPTIIEASVPEMRYLGTAFFTYVHKRMADSNVPFVLHLDHGNDINVIKEAIAAGFNSVMIDASTNPFEENIKLTREVVTYAYAHQVCVEAELGTIGNTQSSSCSDGLDTKIIYTEPQKAKEFCEQTGVDALAVAIGTSHGMYTHGNTPKLRIDILQDIQKACDICLVLHGGSGNADQEIQTAIQNGITKVNISSEVKAVYLHTLANFMKEHPYEVKTQVVFAPAKKAACDMIKQKMQLFQTAS